MNKIRILKGLDIIVPSDNVLYVQKNSDIGTIIFPSFLNPKNPCTFSVQSSEGGLYILNNSNVKYEGSRFIAPNKVCQFSLSYTDSWKICCGEGTLENNNIIIHWTKFFNKKVTGPPPLAARKYAIFINGIYNALLHFSEMFDQAVINEAANVLYSLINTGSTSSIYDKYPKLDTTSLTAVTTFVTNFKNSLPIPPAATNPSHVLPSPAKEKWFGEAPVLPNWNDTTIAYLANSYNLEAKEPFTNMASDAKSLQEIKRTKETDEVAYHFANTPPPAHMIAIACSMIANRDLSSISCAKLLALLAIGLADAGIYAWKTKYAYWGARPFQYISNFTPLIKTPNFPGYTSGHSTFSAAWDQILGMMLPSHKDISKYIADLSGMSRLYGGIHFSSDNIIGLNSGREIGKSVYMNLLNKIKNNEPFL